MRPFLPLAATATFLLAGCGGPPPGVDLLGVGERLVEVRAAGASREDREELARFEREMFRFASRKDGKGRRAFAIPRRRSSDDAEWTALDRVSMREWLTRSGFSGARLFWFAEYATRDDFGSSLDDTSAWAGIHYFASRLRGTSPDGPFEEPASFLTWPEGNGRLVKRLVEAAGGRIVTLSRQQVLYRPGEQASRARDIGSRRQLDPIHPRQVRQIRPGLGEAGTEHGLHARDAEPRWLVGGGARPRPRRWRGRRPWRCRGRPRRG